MKSSITKLTILTLTIVAFAIPSVIHAATLTKPPNNLGLVGYWSMNDGAGTIAGDFSGNGNDGDITGATWATGKYGGGLSFDGDDFVDLGTGVGDYTDNFTIAGWFKTSGAEVRPLVSRRNSDIGTQYDIFLASGRLALYDGDSYTSTGTVNDNEWHHGVVVINGASSKFYVDGVDKGTFSPTIVSRNVKAIIGAQNDGVSGNMIGSIDEVRMYNRALGATEITSLYNAGLVKIGVSGLSNAILNASQNDKLTSGLVGLWSFDGVDTTSTIAYDRTPAVDSGFVLDDYTTNLEAAYSLRKLLTSYSGNAIRVRRSSDNAEQDIGFDESGDLDTSALTTFVGAGDGFITIWYDQSGNANNGTETTALWQNKIVDSGSVIVDAAGVPTTEINVTSGSQLDIVNLVMSSFTLYFYGQFSGDGYLAAHSSLNRQVRIGISGTEVLTLFDGSLSNSTTLTNARTTYNLYGYKSNAGSTAFFENGTAKGTGTIGTAMQINLLFGKDQLTSGHASEVIIYSTAQSDADRNAIEENVGTYYAGGSGNNGTITGATRTIGRIGQALSFDGTSDYVSIGDMGNINSISFWLKADDVSSRKVVNIDGTDQIEINGSSEIVATSFPASTVYVDGSVGSTITNDWHHVVVIDSTGVSAATFEIGRVSSSYFIGKIDDVRIYNRVLTPAEVNRLYRMGN